MSEPAWRIGPEHLDAATRVVAAHATRTPLVPGTSIHPRVWLKLEAHQHTGSFKVRGALTRLASLSPAEKGAGVVTASAGNHGLGVSYAAARLDVRAKVYVPRSTPAVKRDGIGRLGGAEVVVCEHEGYDATEQEAHREAESSGAVFVSPYDDPWVAAGNGGTVGFEILDALPTLDAIVCPVGGGGLICGIAAARETRGRDVGLVGVNTEASPGMLRSFEEGHAVEALPPAETLAEGLEGGVKPTTYLLAREAGVQMAAVSEAEIADAMRFARDVLGTPVEGSGAVGITWARNHADAMPGTGAIVVVVTGRNVDPERLATL